jgi:hypothetical protein
MLKIWLGLVVCGFVFAGPGHGQQVKLATLDAAIEQSHRALAAILNGDPKLYAALFSDREDITLGNPFGPFGKGPAAVEKALANAAGKYHDGQGDERGPGGEICKRRDGVRGGD